MNCLVRGVFYRVSACLALGHRPSALVGPVEISECAANQVTVCASGNGYGQFGNALVGVSLPSAPLIHVSGSSGDCRIVATGAASEAQPPPCGRLPPLRPEQEPRELSP